MLTNLVSQKAAITNPRLTNQSLVCLRLLSLSSFLYSIRTESLYLPKQMLSYGVCCGTIGRDQAAFLAFVFLVKRCVSSYRRSLLLNLVGN